MQGARRDGKGGSGLTFTGASTSATSPLEASQDLIDRVRRGDRAALRALYDAHGGRLLAAAHALLRQRQEAEDVVQETFVEVWRRAPEYDPGRGTVVAWMMTMARTRAIDRLRSRAVADRTARAAPEPAASVAMPLELAEARQDRERVSAALGALPPDQKTVIDLAYYEGLSQREISERLAEPLGTIKTRVRLAMQKLSALLLDGGAS